MDDVGQPRVRFRVRVADVETHEISRGKLRRYERFRFTTALSDYGEPSRWLVVEKWHYDAATEDDRSEGKPQLIDVHQRSVEERIREIARRLALPDDYTGTLAIAARLHDEGKLRQALAASIQRTRRRLLCQDSWPSKSLAARRLSSRVRIGAGR